MGIVLSDLIEGVAQPVGRDGDPLAVVVVDHGDVLVSHDGGHVVDPGTLRER
jgi:hypothetical protein